MIGNYQRLIDGYIAGLPNDQLVPAIHQVVGPIDVESSRHRHLGRWSGAHQALAAVVPGGPTRIVGRYSSSWMRPSNVRLLVMSRATSG